MDIVIPLGSGSKHNNLELRYALRSIEKFFPDHGQIFIIGERPEFIHHIIHIPAYDTPESRWKEQNIFLKVMLAIDHPCLSKDFVLFNDDHFLLQVFEIDFYFKGSLAETLAKKTLHESYANTIRNTMQIFPEGLDYDVHCPMVINGEIFKHAVATKEWHIPFGYSLQSLYGNVWKDQSKYHPDCKIRTPMSSEQIQSKAACWKFFSIADESFNDEMKLVLAELYPIKSRYEL